MAKKEVKIQIENFDEVDKALLELSRHESFIAKKEAEMNTKIQKIRDDYDEATKDARAQKTLIETEVERYCLVNKAEFANKRSTSLIHGSVGFRTNPPKVQQLNKKYNVKTSIELLKKIFTGKYIRAKEEINKDELLVDYANKSIDDQQLAAVGLKVDQDETFYYEINWDSLQEKAA